MTLLSVYIFFSIQYLLKMRELTKNHFSFTLLFILLLVSGSKVDSLSNVGGSRSSAVLKVNHISGDEGLSKETSSASTMGVGSASNEEDDKEKASLESLNDSTFTTASLMTQLLRNNGKSNEHETVQYLDRVKNPEEVAIELESAAKYLMHQAELTQAKLNHSTDTEKDGGESQSHLHYEEEDKNMDLVRVLDGLVIFNNLYDALVRPGQFDGDMPTTITVNAEIHPWLEIDEEKNELTLTLTLTQNWTDTRLAYQSRLQHPEKLLPYVTLTSHMHSVELWLPDTFIMNEKRSYKHDVTMPNDLMRISSKGEVSREQRVTVTVHCPFYKNERFPFDTPACSLNLSSFSWNTTSLRYHWAPTTFKDLVEPESFSESSGFTVSSIELKTIDFKRDDMKIGPSSGLIVEFKLRRDLSSYLAKLYLPLGSFCVIAIIGLISPIGPEIGAALSYFMFGLQSIFMAISFNGPDFNWGNSGTALDSYYVLSVLTILLTGIVNIFKLGMNSSPNKPTTEESYEMHRSTPNRTIIQSRSTSASRNSTREPTAGLWKDSDNFIDDHDMDMIEEEDNYGDDPADIRNRSQTTGHTSYPSGLTGSILTKLKLAKLSLSKLRKRCCRFCYRLLDFSVWILLIIFITWNSIYWKGVYLELQ